MSEIPDTTTSAHLLPEQLDLLIQAATRDIARLLLDGKFGQSQLLLEAVQSARKLLEGRPT